MLNICCFDLPLCEKVEPDTWYREGWYSVKYSDGGQDYTNSGPVWVEGYWDLTEMYLDASLSNSDTHIAYVEYCGSFDAPVDVASVKPYQRVELEAYLGDYVGDFDVDMIELFATAVDSNGVRWWVVDDSQLAQVVLDFEIEADENAPVSEWD